MRNAGIRLLVAANALLLYTSLAAPAYGRAHPNLGAAVISEYAAPWPVALASAVAGVGIMLALVPIRRGERWAIWTSLATLGLLLGCRLATDPRCLVVLDAHQHGCHTFMLAVAMGGVGLWLTARASRFEAKVRADF
jgi:hypothetical protein